MTCSQCQGLDTLFDKRTAAKELKNYRKKGPSKTTRWLIDALKAEGIVGATLLDIGGGIGAIQHELLKAGASGAINVDAASAYIEAAQEEAHREGLADRVRYHHGDFVQLAAAAGEADIVTLDRTICCYHDMAALVGHSTSLTRNLYGLVYPRDTWWVKFGLVMINFVSWLQREPYRFFAHPNQAVDALIRRQGLVPRFYRKTLLWQVAIYGRDNKREKQP